jgi:hypothetical protein
MHFVARLLVFFGVAWSVHAADIPASLDRFHFLAGLSIVGAGFDYISPPQCESFFREGGEQRPAELFLAAAQNWKNTQPIHFYDPSGKRLVIQHQALSEALRAFYAPPDGPGSTELGLIRLPRQQRLSFVAGIYARTFRDGAFHGAPSPAMRATVLILLAEGCQVSHLAFSEHEVPDSMYFRVTPTKPVADLFASVNDWRPPHVEWQPK